MDMAGIGLWRCTGVSRIVHYVWDLWRGQEGVDINMGLSLIFSVLCLCSLWDLETGLWRWVLGWFGAI